MKLFLRSQDNDMWTVITDGDFVPTTKEGAVKAKSAWSTDEKAQAKDLKSMNLEDLIGSLRAHEVLLQGDKPVKKVKTLAFKASQPSSSAADDDVQESQELEEVHEEEAEDELALISKRIQRMMLRRNQIRKKFPNTNMSTKTEADKSQVTCFGCNKTGHYKSECPDIKKVKRKPPFKKKAMITWVDMEESDPQEDADTDMGLMAQSDDEEEVLPQGARTKPWYLDSGCSRHMTGYSTTSKGYRVYNLKIQTVEISMHIIFDEYDEHSQPKENEDTEVSTLQNVPTQNTVNTVEKEDDQNVQDQSLQSPPRSWRMVGDHPADQIIESTTDGIRTRLSFQDNNMAMISQMEPKSINEAIIDDSWIEAMKEELSQFERNKVWNLVPNNQDKTIIGTRWVFRNKLDEEGKVVRNKARTKTISKSSDNETNQVEQSQPPPPNAAADQTSDQQLLSETPVRTILQDVIIPASETPKSSKTRSSKKPIIKPRPKTTRRSTRMKKPLKKPKVSHVNLDSNEEKEDSSDDEDSEDETEEDPEEEDEDSEQTLSDAMKSVKASSKRDKELTKKILQRRKEIAAEAMPLSEEKTSEDEEESEEEESEEKAEKEEEKGSSKKYGKGKDITKLAATLKASRAEKIALRPMSRTKYFNLESLETKAWNLKEFTEP
ncbi:bromodomain-containing protein DDB_G0278469-like [Medicago truncatula]|uniref:bromodomain-containing protein DDB_G0278469-like n=1 Tax=Medicago truncatula TaxID=3880 RepID=UPI0019670CDC|nr:bromodomain-containing protein DDB_G0278469-like [Medicago truncatula]